MPPVPDHQHIRSRGIAQPRKGLRHNVGLGGDMAAHARARNHGERVFQMKVRQNLLRKDFGLGSRNGELIALVPQRGERLRNAGINGVLKQADVGVALPVGIPAALRSDAVEAVVFHEAFDERRADIGGQGIEVRGLNAAHRAQGIVDRARDALL